VGGHSYRLDMENRVLVLKLHNDYEVKLKPPTPGKKN